MEAINPARVTIPDGVTEVPLALQHRQRDALVDDSAYSNTVV